MTSLTDRYVAATLRNIPPRQRAELERELRASIADAMEDQSEVDALSSLGEPSRLAASYTERPLHLIGPALFLDYRRAMGIMLSTVIPLIVVSVGITSFRDGAGFGAALSAAVNAGLLVAMHIAIWTTVVFAVIERLPGRRPARARSWDPTTLPELPAKRIDLGGLIGGSAMTAVIAAVLIVMQSAPIGPIEPALWNSGALLIVVIFAAASVCFDVIGYYVGWGLPQAVANAVLSAIFIAATLGVIRSGQLLNERYFEAVGWPDGVAVMTWVIVIVIVLLSLTNAVDGFTRARASRAGTAKARA